MAEHDLKTWPESFAALLSGAKTHEVRRNDRGFAVGDVLLLREFDPDAFTGGYTGSHLRRLVTYVTPGGAFGLPAGLCVMSVRRPDDGPAPEVVPPPVAAVATAALDAGPEAPMLESAMRTEIVAAVRQWILSPAGQHVDPLFRVKYRYGLAPQVLASEAPRFAADEAACLALFDEAVRRLPGRETQSLLDALRSKLERQP